MTKVVSHIYYKTHKALIIKAQQNGKTYKSIQPLALKYHLFLWKIAAQAILNQLPKLLCPEWQQRKITYHTVCASSINPKSHISISVSLGAEFKLDLVTIICPGGYGNTRGSLDAVSWQSYTALAAVTLWDVYYCSLHGHIK